MPINKLPVYLLTLVCSIFPHTSAVANSEIYIPPGPNTYGFTAWWNNGTSEEFSQDAQSFIALGSLLTRVTIDIKAQTEPDVSWQYQLWNDQAGSPNTVIAEFGSFRPSSEYKPFDVQLDSPIALTIGQRYYIGLSPELTSAPSTGSGLAGILVRGFRETDSQDAYPAGTVWAIRNPGSAGEVLRQPNSFDFSISISTVPEPANLALLAIGLIFLQLRRTTMISTEPNDTHPKREA